VLLGVGCIVGAGIYVLPGVAAANFAGPAVMLSFLLAGAACCLTALCYAELASAMPVSGSAYAYSYVAIGQGFAWAIGWLLLFEYGVAAALLAVGFSGYLVSLLGDFALRIPIEWTTPLIRATPKPGGFELAIGPSVNLIASLAIAGVTLVLVRGMSTSALVNNVLVFIKVAILATLVVVGFGSIDTANYHPFIPPNEGGFAYGWQGVVRAASIIFFAYIGFETVSTAAAEARNPARDLPIGIVGSLVACTVIYVLVAAVLTGIVPYRELGVPDPIAVAVDRLGMPILATAIKFGALVGLSSVLLVNAFGQSRVGFAMSRDGLLPPIFSRLSASARTPAAGIIAFGVIAAIGAALLPLSVLGDLTSIGISFSFAVVCFTVMWLRNQRPDLPRPFRVPLGGFRCRGWWVGYVPLLGMLLCSSMAIPVAIDITRQALQGQLLPLFILAVYALLGAVVYFTYGIRHAKLAQSGSIL
jgi:APA family basic amino acid/polyamine antiporter